MTIEIPFSVFAKNLIRKLTIHQEHLFSASNINDVVIKKNVFSSEIATQYLQKKIGFLIVLMRSS